MTGTAGTRAAPPTRTALRGGTLVDADGSRPGDLLLEGDRVVDGDPAGAGTVVDCTGRLVLPGLVDAHSHADAAVFEPEVALALLRQGVTTVVAGQDGVSFAPGDGAFASRYFAALNGRHPTYRGPGVAALLAAYDGTTPVNLGYLVPAGTVREQVRGLRPGPATPDEVAAMQDLVAAGLADGALGLSTGLDYVPGLFAGTDEITALCRPLAAVDALYVTHMRGGYEDNAAAGLDEVVAICRAAGVRGHVSHLHARSALVRTLVDRARAQVDLTFDSYPYSRGSSLLSMLLLPPELLQAGVAACTAALADPAVRADVLASWVPVLAARADMGPRWADQVRYAHVAAPGYAWLPGLSLAEAAERAGTSAAELGLRVLAAADLEVGVVMQTPVERGDAELALAFTHPAHVGGSDGIYRGAVPHPRGHGTFALYLQVFVAERGDLSWADAVRHHSTSPAQRFGLAGRGSLRPGSAADVVLLDPATLRSRATYADPRALAEGVDDVWVNGARVLQDGALTGVTSGRGLRRGVG
ncbi:N-acyl-D-amino-acid deacylase [Friedmanniella luteola]|uniref:N-acyl-D-amino-acid deacylase n=1 Tax=Friedmanniella luteola TaxID=546871 RepID=A0A1H1L689_9ACTN|nr:amidohydrolase family protein [Friedmanniella luteola]SDR69555.1 N-acyl-D-amino-acid deacylase [Friedmanniella luteola]